MRQIFGYAYDGDPGIVRARQAESDAPADGILARPIAAGPGLIDDCYHRGLLVHVLHRQIATPDERNPKGAKIFRTNHLPARETDIGWIQWSAFDGKGIIARDAAQWCGSADTRSLDARQFFNALYQLL